MKRRRGGPRGSPFFVLPTMAVVDVLTVQAVNAALHPQRYPSFLRKEAEGRSAERPLSTRPHHLAQVWHAALNRVAEVVALDCRLIVQKPRAYAPAIAPCYCRSRR